MTQQLLVEQNAALVDFLDDLLTEPVPEAVDSAAATPEQVPPATTPVPLPGLRSAENRSDPDDIPVTGSAAAQPANDRFRETVPERLAIIPEWGTTAFQAMIFKVGDLSLAIPVVQLTGVVEWRPEPGAETRASGFYLGNHVHAGQSVTVIDSARLVFPDRRFKALYGAGINPRISRLILIDGGNFGLACDEVDDIIQILPDQVNWRSAKTRHQWLAGTMLEQLIVVLDAGRTSSLLAAGADTAHQGV